ncbi:MAG: hypothetical protein WCT46_05235 [Candidatus Gracilibacteria bacterium]|jgi:hypothetical protein
MENKNNLSSFTRSLISALSGKISPQARKIIDENKIDVSDYIFWITTKYYKRVFSPMEMWILFGTFLITSIPSVIALFKVWSLRNLFVMITANIMIYVPMIYFIKNSVFSSADSALDDPWRGAIFDKVFDQCKVESVQSLTGSDWDKIRNFSAQPDKKKIFQIHKLFKVPLPAKLTKKKRSFIAKILQPVSALSCGSAILCFIAFFIIQKENLSLMLFFTGVWFLGFWFLANGLKTFLSGYFPGSGFDPASTGAFAKMQSIVAILIGIFLIIVFFPWLNYLFLIGEL